MLPHVTAPGNPCGGTRPDHVVRLRHGRRRQSRAARAKGDHARQRQRRQSLRRHRHSGAGRLVAGVIRQLRLGADAGERRMIPTDGSTIAWPWTACRSGRWTTTICRAGATNRPPAGTCHDDIATLFPNARNITGASGAIGRVHAPHDDVDHRGAYHRVGGHRRPASRGRDREPVLHRVTARSSLTATGLRRRQGSANALAAAPPQLLGSADDLAWRSVSVSDIEGRAGFDFGLQFETVRADTAGVRRVRMPELGRIELRLGSDTTAGYLRANGTLRPLAAGQPARYDDGRVHVGAGPGLYRDLRPRVSPGNDAAAGVGGDRAAAERRRRSDARLDSICRPLEQRSPARSRWPDGRSTPARGKGRAWARCTSGRKRRDVPAAVCGFPRRRGCRWGKARCGSCLRAAVRYGGLESDRVRPPAGHVRRHGLSLEHPYERFEDARTVTVIVR